MRINQQIQHISVGNRYVVCTIWVSFDQVGILQHKSSMYFQIESDKHLISPIKTI